MTTSESDAPSAEEASADLGPLPLWMKPAVDWVARRDATVHVKLLFGFLSIAVLLLALGIFSIGVLNRVDDQVKRITVLHDQSDGAREMIYKVTAQSHFRAMALLTQIDKWDDKIYTAKDSFAEGLSAVRAMSATSDETLFDEVAAVNSRFEAESMSVSEVYYAGELDRAEDLHLQVEHETSHELEDQLNELISTSDVLAIGEVEKFKNDRRLLTFAVAAFSAASLAVALLMGAVLSWSLIRPVRRVDRALERIADGDFEQYVEVPNRDEFGSLTANLNKTSAQLGALYTDLKTLNTGLQETVERKVKELSRADRLRRYVSPQLAESILAGDTEVVLGSSRKLLTVFLSDIRGFTEMTERMEPEHLVNELNEYLTEMTEIVFRHGGTLDKYIGDAILVFFGDPVPQDDHAQRALKMALEMQDRVEELADRWTATYGESFQIGIGITTGWVTVGNIGSPARTDYTVLGNEVNLAARLTDRAAPGEILVTERTMMEGQDLVSGEVVDEVTLKGVSRPIKIYSLTRPARGAAEGTEGVPAGSQEEESIDDD
jgi:class 3 adenylate cyclase/HAMP domain-containing protein